MADAAPLLPGLPDEIAVWEILVRLPPKPLLRCRAVSPAWRRATSARDFLLSHHARQPALTLLYNHNLDDDQIDYVHRTLDGLSLDIVPFNHDRFQSVARLKKASASPWGYDFYIQASCDGLLVVSMDKDHLCICNPATRQFAPLQQLDGFNALGLYPHPSATHDGEYRLLLHFRWDEDEDQGDIYVFTLGSGQLPREIECQLCHPNDLLRCFGFLFHGSLHFYMDGLIMIFDTITESFWQIRAPEICTEAQLFEMDDMLAISSPSNDGTAVDIWVMRDYQAEVWDFKYRVQLPLAEIKGSYVEAMVVPRDSGLLVVLSSYDGLSMVDVDGKLVDTFNKGNIYFTHYLLKQTLVQHTFFPALEGYVVNALPFIRSDDDVVDT